MAAVRVAVRRGLADLPADAVVVVALSGGPDSTALLAAATFERPHRVAAVVVDHGWSPGSAEVAERAAAAATTAGAAPVQVRRALPTAGETAARAARYSELDAAAAEFGAAAVLLGHTLDDQAETVLLGLARGSGARSLAGMAAQRGLLRRPLLGLRRATTVTACADLGLTWWDDPANADPRHARVRVRHRVLPVLEAELGPGIAAALARTAGLLRDDADALDAAARAAVTALGAPETGWDCAVLAALPAAVRARALRALAPARSAVQVAAVDALVTAWHGQGPVTLPGGATVLRRRGRILLTSPVRAGEPSGRERRSAGGERRAPNVRE